MGIYSSALIPDTEEFVSIVSVTEKLNEQADERFQSELQTLVTPMEVEKENQSNELESHHGTNRNGSALSAAEPKNMPTQSLSSLLPKVLSAVLHPRLPPGLDSNPEPTRNLAKHTSSNLEQLQTELRDLREQFEQMKSQHNKEIKLLMNELDEEKRIRLTLQMEIQRMKKHMSK